MTTFLIIFASVFLAELGDKTQLATMLFGADAKISKWTVFAASSLALVLCSALGVLAGSLLGNLINPKILAVIAGGGFIIIGIFVLVSGLRGS
jgi:putative Ca2+/H+ antiporter (TMEM165/GDT1 family)